MHFGITEKPTFAGTHCAYPRRDGQSELIWVAGYIPRWFTRPQTVTHPSTNRARRTVTFLIAINELTTTLSYTPLLKKKSEEIASENTENCRRRQPHCRLTPPPQRTPSNIRINLI